MALPPFLYSLTLGHTFSRRVKHVYPCCSLYMRKHPSLQLWFLSQDFQLPGLNQSKEKNYFKIPMFNVRL